MSATRVIYHLARADFLERVRRYSFLVMLGLVVLLGYQTAIGNVRLQLGQYRGEFNSAWIGGMMAIITTFFLGWFGFYLVKGSVARDRETGVGQIMATTPMSRPFYMLGKWISNFAVLMAMVVILVIFGLVIQLLRGESTGLDLSAYLSPFVFIVTPLMGMVAAVAVLFESIPFLAGGFGNVVYFFAFVMIIPFTMEAGIIQTNPALEPLGMALLKEDMAEEVLQVFPDYDNSFMLGGLETPITGTFTWHGIDWTPSVVTTRFAYIGLAILVTLLGALFFDRFDPSRGRPLRIKSTPSTLNIEPASIHQALPAVQLTPLNRAANRFRFFNVLTAELKLLLKGQRWWWYIAAAGLIVACLVSPAETTRQFILPYTWVWPVLIWSSMGSRETRHNVQQFTFTSASPLWRQLPAQWIAGLIVTLVMGSGAVIRFVIEGDSTGLIAFLSAALFIPSLAFALGVWSNSSKPFEIVYVTLWYLGPLNKTPGLDFIGAYSVGYPELYIPLSMALIAFALFGRARQLRN
ncbi:MAG TPA: ABC transporter permease subunit [Anaerolineales bacterium]|nr:ABC transporter permease subunit [Anaerolineales bacterium]